MTFRSLILLVLLASPAARAEDEAPLRPAPPQGHGLFARMLADIAEIADTTGPVTAPPPPQQAPRLQQTTLARPVPRIGRPALEPTQNMSLRRGDPRMFLWAERGFSGRPHGVGH